MGAKAETKQEFPFVSSVHFVVNRSYLGPKHRDRGLRPNGRKPFSYGSRLSLMASKSSWPFRSFSSK